MTKKLVFIEDRGIERIKTIVQAKENILVSIQKRPDHYSIFARTVEVEYVVIILPEQYNPIVKQFRAICSNREPFWLYGKLENLVVDMGDLLQRAINHDMLEMATGDIISNTKRRTPEMKQAIDSMEELVWHEELVKDIPNSWRESFKKYILEPKDDTIEGKIIVAADLIDALLESVEEIKLGNDEQFGLILQEISHALIKIELESVRYFLKYALQDFGLDISKHYGVRLAGFIRGLEFDERVFLD